MNRSFLNIYIILLVTSFTTAQAYGGPEKRGMRASPLSIEIKAQGSEVSQAFQIHVFTDKPAQLKATLVRVVQSLDGNLEPVEMPDNAPERKIIKFAETSKTMRRAGMWIIEGVVNLKTSLYKNAAIYGVLIEETPLSSGSGASAGAMVNVRVRYLVQLRINPGKVEKRPSGKFEIQDFSKNKGRLFLNGSFESKSSLLVEVTSEVTVRDSQRRVVEKIILKTPSVLRAKGAGRVRVLPGAKVKLTGMIQKINSPGLYQISVLNKLNGKNPVIATKTIEITKEMLDNSKLTVTPEAIELPYHQGLMTSFSVEFVNPTNKPVVVELLGRGKIAKNKGEYGWAPSRLELAPHSAQKAQFRAINFYEMISLEGVEAIFKDASGKIIQRTQIPTKYIQPKNSK